MKESLKDRIKSYSDVITKKKNEIDLNIKTNKSRLPLVLLFVKSGIKKDKDLVLEWFEGSISTLVDTNLVVSGKNDFINSISFCLSELNSHNDSFGDAIIIDNVKSVDNGALLAKTTAEFTDLIYINDTKQLDMFERMSHLVDEHNSIEVFASQLDDKLWECYDFLRSDFTKNGFDTNAMHSISDNIFQFKNKNNILIKNCNYLLDKLRI